MTEKKSDSKKIRYLIYSLLFSGSINIFFLSVFFYWHFKEIPTEKSFQTSPFFLESQTEKLIDHRSSFEVVEEYRKLSFRKLSRKLQENHLVEDGFSRRDFALACLTAFHHFDFLRAIDSQALPRQKRIFLWKEDQFCEPISLFLYPDLSEAHFESILNFIKTEKWPFTEEGLFLSLKSTSHVHDPSLVEAFFHTPLFRYFESCFYLEENRIDRFTLLQLLVELDWPFVSSFYFQEKEKNCFSDEQRRLFLWRCIAYGSKKAASLVLKTDFSFIVKKWPKEQIERLLSLLSFGEHAEKFALALLLSAREDHLLQKASHFLYRLHGKPIPDSFDREQAILEFAPDLFLVKQVEKTVVKKKEEPVFLEEKKEIIPKISEDQVYQVQEGDSLWKISRKLGVDLEKLKKHNHLERDLLQPGTLLKIPS